MLPFLWQTICQAFSAEIRFKDEDDDDDVWFGYPSNIRLICIPLQQGCNSYKFNGKNYEIRVIS